MVQHRHAVQPDLPQLLHRIVAAQRQAGLSDARRGARRISTRSRATACRRSLIGFTGGEPFMNPDIIAMLDDVLSRGLDALVLTNAMQPMRKLRPQMLALREAYGARLTHPRLARSLHARRCTRPNVAGEAGRRRWMAWSGWRATASPSTSPAGASPASRRLSSAPASRGCSPNSTCRSMPTTRCA